MSSPAAHCLPMTAHADALIGGDFLMTVELFTDEQQTKPADLTGCRVTVSIGDLFELADGDGITVEDPGTVLVRLTAEQTGRVVATVPAAVHHYVLRIETPEGTVLFPVVGDITFHRP